MFRNEKCERRKAAWKRKLGVSEKLLGLKKGVGWEVGGRMRAEGVEDSRRQVLLR